MYEDYLEDLFKYSVKFVARKLKKVVTSKKSNEKSEAHKEIENHTSNEESKNEDDSTTNGKENEKALENASQKSNTQEPVQVGGLSAIHFHVTVFLLWLLTAIIYIPTVLVWAKNYHYSVILEKDPALIPSVVLSICGAVLWQPGVPFSNR